MSSEALDRLWPLHLVARFDFPPFFGLGEVGWFGVIQAGSLVGGIAAVWMAGRLTRLDDPRSLARSLLVLAALLIAAALGFALAGGFGMALAMLWVTGWARAAQEPLFLAWVNRGLDSRSRATVLSVFGQADALGQVAGGPALGVLATVRSVRAALVAVGLVLLPSLPLYGWASRREPRETREVAAPE
jgi:DHA3 family tetracycline resistance protein-like MFS transporter